ncbi:RNA polymerase sigma factor [Cytobacillus sp. FJAT-54145]|uniref:RNA polymerase sigma factor n=1 Tax=Cytobacillus spartinae TaxID=3299023 RepID=A0ABW6KIB8_9BACI
MEAGQQIEKWFYKYEKDILNYLIYYTGSMDVEDLVQDTFIKAYQAYDRYRSDANPKTWLISIARNTAIDSYRKKGILNKLKQKLLNERPDKVSPAPIEQLLKDLESKNLYEAISKLKTNYRDVVLLRGIAELSSAEAAQVLGWSVNKVNVTFSRATSKLNSVLKEGIEYEQSF